MKMLLAFIAAVLTSIALYVGVFSVVQRPLTLGDLTQQFDRKLDYASHLPSPKIMIFAGSNGRYSHRCDEFSRVLQRPCVNASIAAGIGLDFQLDHFGAVLRRGDVLYMPLEYSQYGVIESEMHGGVQNAVMLRHRPGYLWSLDPWRIVQAYGAYDLPFIIRGGAEMALARASFRRRTGIETLTEQGDERGHTAERGAAYAAAIVPLAPSETRVPESSYAESVLSAFLVDARRRGIVVVGGWPTVPDGTVISPADAARIRRLYENSGQSFIDTPSQSRYPRECFFDVPYHLNEACQQRHSRVIAELLVKAITTTTRVP